MLEFLERLSKYHLLTKRWCHKDCDHTLQTVVFWVVASVVLYMDNKILQKYCLQLQSLQQQGWTTQYHRPRDNDNIHQHKNLKPHNDRNLQLNLLDKSLQIKTEYVLKKYLKHTVPSRKVCFISTVSPYMNILSHQYFRAMDDPSFNRIYKKSGVVR